MKQLISISVFFLLTTLTNYCYCQDGASGFLYKDALTLYTNLQSQTNPKTVAGIIAYYFNDNTINQGNVSARITAASSNTFLNDATLLAKINNLMTGKVGEAGNPQGASGGIFGSNVTNYADGIAKFLISRGKEELSMAFFDRLKNDLGKYPELTYLFPKTVDIINNIQDYNILTLLQELRDAFMKDLTNEPANILSLRDIDVAKCQNGDNKCQKRIPQIKTALQNELLVIALNIIQNVSEGNNIIATLDKTANDEELCSKNDEGLSYFKLSSILLQSFRADQEKDGLFINEANFKNLFSSKDLLNIFFGLVYQKYTTIDCYKSLCIGGSDLQKIFTNIITTRNAFYGALTSFDNINTSYLAIKSKILKGDKIDNSFYASYVSSCLSSVSKIIKTYSSVVLKSPTLSNDCDILIKNLNTGSDFCIDIQQRNFPGIFNSCIRLINTNKIFDDDNTKEKIVKYLSFASNLASATSSDEVENVIETVALPPGSYSIKQKSAFNISLNGYLGYSFDFNGGFDLYAKGLYAPVGISGSIGLGKNHQWALSLFTSFIDVGGIVSYRLMNGPTDTLKQTITLESIISPSAQLIIGIPKTPIAFCGGWRMTPKLFYSGQTTFIPEPAKSVFNLSVLIDIPIFTLYNKPYAN